MKTYFIADDNGTIYAHDIQSREKAEAILVDTISAFESKGEAIPDGIEILSDDEEITLEISRINIKSETFCTPWNGQLYCVDICEDAEERGAWLYNASYGIKSFMFGTSVKQDNREEFLDMVFSNLPDYIEDYAEEYED